MSISASIALLSIFAEIGLVDTWGWREFSESGLDILRTNDSKNLSGFISSEMSLLDKEIRETFHDEIRCILVELSEAGERKPTGGQMRSYLKEHPKKAPRFVQVDRKGDIHFDSDAAGKKITKMTRRALHKLINRYATKTV